MVPARGAINGEASWLSSSTAREGKQSEGLWQPNRGWIDQALMSKLIPFMVLYIVFIHLYSASCSAHHSEELPVRETQGEHDGALVEAMAHWLRRLLSTGGSWVRLPLWPSRRDLGQVLYLQLPVRFGVKLRY